MPELLFHLRRGPLLGGIVGHEDERSVLRNLFLNASFDLSLRMAAPRCLMHREGGTFEELPAHDLAMQSDAAVVLDHGTDVFIWLVCHSSYLLFCFIGLLWLFWSSFCSILKKENYMCLFLSFIGACFWGLSWTLVCMFTLRAYSWGCLLIALFLPSACALNILLGVIMHHIAFVAPPSPLPLFVIF